MLALLVGLLLIALPIVLIVKLSGRRFPGDITGPQGNQIDYDDPYPGWWTFFQGNSSPPRPPAPAGPVGAPAIESIPSPPAD